MRHITAFFILFALASMNASAQTNFIYAPNELLKSSDIESEITDYSAKLKRKPKDADLHLALGYCYVLSADSKNSAIQPLKKAVELLEKKKKSRETDYLKAKILLGQAYRINMRFGEAEVYFKKILPLMKERTLSEFVQREIQLCKNGQAALKNPKYVSVMNMKGFNSKFSDHSPMMLNSNSVVFTAKLKTSLGDRKKYSGEYSEDVYLSTLPPAGGNWTKPKPFSRKLKMKDNISNCGISRDGKTIYFYYAGDIHESVYKRGKWRRIKKTDLPVNSKYEEKHISFSADGKTAYFATNRPGGKGGYDIYKIVQKSGGNWSKPVLADDNINTPYDDHSPNIVPDGTLYFSSKGHNSMGGYDIFKAEPNGSGGFEKPENLGFPTNSVEDDIFYYISDDEHRAFFTSTRTGGRGSADIYMVNYKDFLMVQGNTIKQGGKTSGVSHKVFKLQDKTIYENGKLRENGDYSFLAERETHFYAVAEAVGYHFETFAFSSAGDLETEQTVQNLVLEPVTDKPFKQYEPFCDEFNNQMNLFLKTLVRFLQQNPDLTADISMENDAMTQQAVDFLKEYGIKDRQISIYAYKKGDCTVTIYKKEKEPEVVTTEPKTQPDTFTTHTPDEIQYTIQVGAFRRNLDINHWFFKEMRGKILKRNGIDGLHRYTDGVFDTLEEAEAALPRYQAIFWDAFIRELQWYEDLNNGKIVQ